MNYNHPYSTLVRNYFVTTPIVPDVGGRVIAVEVTGDEPVKQGDVLFRLDPTPYEATVALRQAELRAALQKVEGYEASLAASGSEVRERPEPIATAAATTTTAVRRAARPPVTHGRTSRTCARSTSPTRRSCRRRSRGRPKSEVQLAVDASGDNVLVAQAKATLSTAQWELDQTVVRAPTDGFVSQLLLRPGMMAQPLPLRPVGVFVHSEKSAAGRRVLAELAPAHPGRRRGRGDLPGGPRQGLQGKGREGAAGAGAGPAPDRRQPALRGDGAERWQGARHHLASRRTSRAYQLPAGVIGAGAIYTEHVHHVAIMRKILLRMVSWQNYVFGELH